MTESHPFGARQLTGIPITGIPAGVYNIPQQRASLADIVAPSSSPDAGKVTKKPREGEKDKT